ncbi:MAG: hypothetical protein JXK07_09360 [Spirochaetes bacterium]|nr:hypothetical protein [Spirochaetota bacterium]MBN2772478.1 hypothetical protein [Spirochaetota bacterium]
MIYYLNTDFDIANVRVPEGFLAQVYLLNLLPLALAEDDDVIVSHVRPEENYYKYLAQISGNCGSLVIREKCKQYLSSELYLWGINSDSLSLVCDPESYPDIINVAKANCRSFSLEVSKKMGSLIRREIVSSIKDVCGFAENNDYPLVVKPLCGSSAYGFNIVQTERCLEKIIIDNRAVCEQWVKRVSDFSYGFCTSKEGDMSLLTLRSLDNSPRGIFSSVFCPASFRDSPLYGLIKKSANKLSGILFKSGYFGQVNCDGFFYEGRSGIQKEICCEINARRSIADLAILYGKRFGVNCPGIVSIQQKSYSPGLYQKVTEMFDNSSVRLLTPLRFFYENTLYRSRRLLFFVGGADTDDYMINKRRLEALFE